MRKAVRFCPQVIVFVFLFPEPYKMICLCYRETSLWLCRVRRLTCLLKPLKGFLATIAMQWQLNKVSSSFHPPIAIHELDESVLSSLVQVDLAWPREDLVACIIFIWVVIYGWNFHNLPKFHLINPEMASYLRFYVSLHRHPNWRHQYTCNQLTLID